MVRVALGTGMIPGWSRAEQGGLGRAAGPSQWWSHSFSCLGAQAGVCCLLLMGWSCCTLVPHRQRAPKLVPVTTKETGVFLCRHTPAAAMRLFRIQERGNTTNRKSKDSWVAVTPGQTRSTAAGLQPGTVCEQSTPVWSIRSRSWTTYNRTENPLSERSEAQSTVQTLPEPAFGKRQYVFLTA